MPLYEYKCKKCDHIFEKLQSCNANNPICPQCEEGNVKRVISTPSLRFKGSGFHVTDYTRHGPK